MAEISVVVPTWNGRDLLDTCLTALATQTRPADEIVVVDNGSTDGTESYLSAHWPAVRVVRLPSNRGFAGGCNAGINATAGDWVALLNNDATPSPGWLAAIESAIEGADADVGAFAGKVLRPDGRLESAGDVLTRSMKALHRGGGDPDDGRWDDQPDVLCAGAAAAVYRRAMLTEVGLLDERFFAYFEDVDLSLRARLRGWTVRYEPRAVVRHAAGSTSSRVPGFRQFHNTRNLWWLTVKDVPARLLAGVLLRVAGRQLRGLLGATVRGELLVTLRAHAAALVGLPAVLADRRRVQRNRRVPLSVVRGWLRVQVTAVQPVQEP
jgi:GT2 family glycosyltransferase